MRGRTIRQLRTSLQLSRSDFARFLGVSEPTVVRWESDESVTEPRGVQAVLLQALAEATAGRPRQEVARIVRSCGINHREALRTLLAASVVTAGR